MNKLLVAAAAVVSIAASAAHAEPLLPVRLGMTKLGAMTSVWVASKNGIFAKHGLDVRFTEIPSSDQSIPLLHARTIDIVLQIPGTAMVAKEAGFDLVLVAQNETAGTTPPVSNAIMVPVDSPIRTIEDLRGKRISLTSHHGQSPAAVREVLQRHGIKPDEVPVTPVPYTASADLLRSHQIDAAATLDPYTTQILKAGYGRVLSWFMVETIPDQPVGAFWATRTWAGAHAKEIAAFNDALKEAHTYLYADPERAKKAVSEYSGLDLALVRDMPLISWKTDVDPAAWQAVADMMQRQGELTRHHDVSEYLLKK